MPEQFPVRVRATLDAVPAYVAGRPAPEVAGLQTYKISSNENPYAPLPSVVAGLAEAAGRVNRYPDMANTALKEGIAAHHGRTAAEVSVGPGSTGVLVQFVQALCSPGDEVVFAWRSFEAYPIVVQLADAVPVPVPLTNSGEHDLEAMAAAITERTKLIFVCSPNNPTGTVIGPEQARAFLRRVPSHVAVVWDEAYLEFATDPVADAPALQAEFPQLIVLRTFSKAYGLAGARVGYALSHPALAEANAKCAIPFSVNLFAQEAALLSLAAHAELADRVTALVAERERLTAGLTAQGWRLPRSQANFVYFPLGPGEAEAFDERCAQHGLMVRRYGTEGVRVTVGEPEATSRLLEITAGFDSALRR